MTLSYEEQRVLRSLAGRAAIGDLSVRQHRSFERGDTATWLGTFVVEGVLELPGQEAISGHPALGSWFAGAPRGQTIVAAESAVDIDGVHGCQQSMVFVLDGGAGDNGAGVSIRSAWTLVDDLVYERGRWYFARRRVSPVGSQVP